jgi:hypothetical protein
MLGSAERVDHPISREQFSAMPLAVIERQAIALKALATSNGQTGGGIESTGEENDGFLGHGARI